MPRTPLGSRSTQSKPCSLALNSIGAKGEQKRIERIQQEWKRQLELERKKTELKAGAQQLAAVEMKEVDETLERTLFSACKFVIISCLRNKDAGSARRYLALFKTWSGCYSTSDLHPLVKPVLSVSKYMILEKQTKTRFNQLERSIRNRKTLRSLKEIKSNLEHLSFSAKPL